MIVRLNARAKRWVLCATTGLILTAPEVSTAQTAAPAGTPQATLEHAVQRETQSLQAQRPVPIQPYRPQPRRTTRPAGPPDYSQYSQYSRPGAPQRTAAPATNSPIQPAGYFPQQGVQQTQGQMPQQTQMPMPQGNSSAVLQELQKLYAQDGRPMPQMNVQFTPQPSPAQSTAGSQPPAAAPEKKPNFLQRLFGVRSRRTQPAPQPPAPPTPQQQQQQFQNPYPPQAIGQRPVAPGVPAAAAAQTPHGAPTHPLAPAAELPPAPASPIPFADSQRPAAATTSAPAPELLIEEVSGDDATVADSAEPAVSEFPNPFPEESEAEADGEPEESPFTGLALEDDDASNQANPFEMPASDKDAETKVAESEPETADDVAPELDAEPELKIKLEPAKIMPPEIAEKASQEDAAADAESSDETASEEKLAADSSSDDGQAEDSAAADAQKDASEAADSQIQLAKQEQGDNRAEKLARIAERKGMTGFKGFCPVALRDQRDLVDTVPEFSSLHGLKTYYFSSAEAKEAFDASPEKYVPANDGLDIVAMAESNQQIEGSLDHAVWFRGRLYLFANSETKGKFRMSPADFAGVQE